VCRSPDSRANGGTAAVPRHRVTATFVDAVGQDEPVTYDGLDTLAAESGQGGAIGRPRPALIVASALPERDESLSKVAVWATEQAPAADS
jgi:hypothetical protein